MKKLILAIVFAFTLPSAAMAHSHMETSVPEDGATVTEPLEEVTLTFSAGIEEGSTLSLTGAEGEAGFTDINIEGDQITGTLAEPLPDGEWTLGWNVVSEDGHPIEGEITFEAAAGVSADDAEEEPVTEEDPADEEEAVADPAESGEQTAEESNASDQTEEGSSVFLTFGLLVAVIILLGVIFWALRKRK
ncbi:MULTISPECIES: copper resistance protein CopC [Bhargavaea]|uniref:Copper resistance protein CopC n=1 Tax=Bhargavaea changchunensis TaxID=2134037 RepID=A0ABW2NB83_9BACL|nr:copper resistance protein CopC [Bhargavaea sp. CC-171006]